MEINNSINSISLHVERIVDLLYLEEKRYKADLKYRKLAVWLGFLRGLYFLHQTHHWQTSGEKYYSDHLLFQRLYEEILPEIDSLAEKIIGLESIRLVNQMHQIRHAEEFITLATSNPDGLVARSLVAELAFVKSGELAMEELKGTKLLTPGLEQSIGNILDLHESHLYLLKRRYTI